MTVFASYAELKNKYLDAQRKFDEILKEKEALFAKTQPKSPKLDKIGSCEYHNTFDEYLINKERYKIDERLAEIKLILEDRERLLSLKKHELYGSKNSVDKVYKMKYLEQHDVPYIGNTLHFSRTQVYRILDVIKKALKY